MVLYTHTLTRADLEHIAENLGVELYNVRDDLDAPRRPRIAFVLRPLTDTFRATRAAYTKSGRRRIWAVCWHGHFAFMRDVFERDPGAELRSGMARYNGREEFYALAELSGDRNIGSIAEPERYGAACLCDAETRSRNGEPAGHAPVLSDARAAILEDAERRHDPRVGL
jgi:hypothetical protein